MFDLGFSELLMVFVVALVVIGPKRMPGLEGDSPLRGDDDWTLVVSPPRDRPIP